MIAFICFCCCLRGSHSNSTRYRRQMLAGYSIPVSFVAATAVVELSGAGGECAGFRPRFGEETCFFTGLTY